MDERLRRYLVEVVEAFDLCPWARASRERGELAVEMIAGEPDDRAWIEAARRTLGVEHVRVALVVAPECTLELGALHAVRNRVTEALGNVGIAEFHPRAALDLASPARAIPFLRRAPYPMLQLVPLSVLEAARGTPPVADRARQIAILRGAPPELSVSDRIAVHNHATLQESSEEIGALLDAIAGGPRVSS